MKRQLIAAAFVGLVATGCASTPALHVIGVHEGEPSSEADDGSFAAKCLGNQEARQRPNSEMPPPVPSTPKPLSIECSQKYAAIQATKGVTVNVTDDSRPIVLALTAYNKTLWKISLKNGVKLTKVILAGYHSQQISGIPPEIPVEIYTYEPSPCKQCWQSAKHFYSYEKPPEQLKEITGLEVTSFQGRYKGSEFSIFPGMKKIE